MSDNTKKIDVVKLVSRHYRGTSEYVLLIDGQYWRASQWEYGMIQTGHHPADLGMIPDDRDDNDE
jgi:hypothetical protein